LCCTLAIARIRQCPQFMVPVTVLQRAQMTQIGAPIVAGIV
jgi:hypothetical protein